MFVLEDYTSALDTFTEMTLLLENCPWNGARSEVLLRCEVSKVLLLLILRPTPQRLAPHLAKLLEKYTWGDKNDKSFQGNRFFNLVTLNEIFKFYY